MTRPDLPSGESTAWYATFWNFLETYLAERFGEDYCLSAIASVELHVGTNTVPHQLVAMTAHGGKTRLNLPHNTSLLVYQDEKGLPKEVNIVGGLRVMPLPDALCRLPPVYFRTNYINAELALRSQTDIGALIRIVIATRSSALAGRFAGAYAFLGDEGKAHDIESAANAAGIDVKRENPFGRNVPALDPVSRTVSPYAGRIQTMIRAIRDPVMAIFRNVKPSPTRSVKACISRIDEVYVYDAYNSLSIEGCQVSQDIIRRIRDGAWNPDRDNQDRKHYDAMAVKGYLETFRLVKKAVGIILNGSDTVKVAYDSYKDWYRALFSEAVNTGLLEAHRLAGFRHPLFAEGTCDSFCSSIK